MKNTIEDYYKRVREEAPDLFKSEGKMHDGVSDDISGVFGNGLYPVLRNIKGDFGQFVKEFGFELPQEIKDYMSIFWHTYIIGYIREYRLGELVLFPVLKFENDSEDVLLYKNGVIELTKKWYDISSEKDYVVIGWLGYSGGFVLYNLENNKIYLEDVNADEEGVVCKEPVAGSLKELIGKLSLTADVWKD